MSQSAATVAVLVPAHQEAAVIAATLRALLPLGHTVVVIDDGSTDDTFAQLQSLPVHYLRHPVNLGQGAALQTGMRYAQRLGVDYVVHFDADGQHEPADIKALLAPLQAGEAEVALGSRFLPGGQADGISPGRRLLLRVAIMVNWWMTGVRLSDAHCGLRALTRQAMASIELHQPGMAHATELLSELRRHRLSYCEVPVRVRYDAYSRQKGQSGWQAIHVLGDLLGL
jgi:glycosyltransferase involved in cell wall biosynthesis